jgi:hypothetical protein
MSTKLSLKEALERRAGGSDERRRYSASPALSFILRARAISQPVEVARFLMRSGLSLKKAHEILNRISDGERVRVELRGRHAETLASKLEELGVSALAPQASND